MENTNAQAEELSSYCVFSSPYFTHYPKPSPQPWAYLIATKKSTWAESIPIPSPMKSSPAVDLHQHHGLSSKTITGIAIGAAVDSIVSLTLH